MSRARRRGFTLVEVAVFMGVGLLVAAAAWSLLRFSMRRGAATDKKLQGVQAELLAAHALDLDLKALYESRAAPLVVAEDGRTLTLFRFTEAGAGEDWQGLALQQVRYRFDPLVHRLTRQVGAGEARAFPGVYESVLFRLAAHPPPAPGELLPEGPALIYSIVASSPEVLGRTAAERKVQDRAVVVGGAPRRVLAGRIGFPHWNPVPYGANDPVAVGGLVP